jgi:hypothetical protein
MTINERVARVADFLPTPSQDNLHTNEPKSSRAQPRTKLRLYHED